MSDNENNGGVNYIVIALIVILAVGLAMGGSYFMLLKFGGLNDGQQEKTAKTTAKKLGPTTKLNQFLVNLSNGNRFIKINVVFEVSNKATIKEIKDRNPQIRDAIISILRTKSYKEITSTRGTRKLRTEIMNDINKLLLKGKITNVFFTEFVVQ
ncbi:flagellar basal body-associated protein [Halobacteroides halobius DSM 5150]|uniref:Flagellar protein FliL n=1 Tax=Halobacteroides halobius (strain ATCC 35273 / DSM 5150 / MD-1) TaxID=748449 RepID=L0K939_HALHC|nr:flagellar basal body-associated FliL family protein [Halobacteroides halobius]AGB40638.1 flagellar basal body-associated protein [Halobacteroides halobius DSM 5150]